MARDSNFVPKTYLINDVTRGQQTVVETTTTHAYEVGQWVRVHVSGAYGMEIDGVGAKVLEVTSTTMTLDFDSTNRLPFVVPSSPYTQAHLNAISGEWNNIAG